ncbi:hypothetical protein Pla108_27340 [Botrimarina colliarenosi]|uniref:Tetratricopeptide repeat protein n=1 Tax=Botrimarina colliarenosi TaxID=2528001 RepID=A0A5C6AC34_9BACT|nr:hypothetical protein [Botrimarina colliarenosi]TWT96957.1 hypothetical protein Pla108_27340 [Botrimarina colliarenosi]
MTRLTTTAVLLLAILALVGCGASGPTAQRRDANRLATEGEAKLSDGDAAGAAADLGAALEQGGLNPDIYEQTITLRAIALAQTGEIDQALASLEPVIEQGSAVDVALAAKAYVLQKKGDTAGAKQAFAQARRLNRTVKPFTDRPNL